MRLNVYVPDDLGETVKEALPDLNVSAVLQAALRAKLECSHERLRCDDCGEVVSGGVDAGEVLAAFWGDLLWAWQPLVDKGGTAEGAARVAKGIAVDAGVPGAELLPLPRRPRRGRAA